MAGVDRREAPRPTRRNDRGKLVLLALADAPDGMSTTEVEQAHFRGPGGVSSPHLSAQRTLRRLAKSEEAEMSGRRARPGGPPVFIWRITDAGRARLAGQGNGRGVARAGRWAAVSKWERCVTALHQLGGEGTSAQVREVLAQGGTTVATEDAKDGLRYLVKQKEPPLAEAVGTAKPGAATLYRLTDAGRTWLAQQDRDAET